MKPESAGSWRGLLRKRRVRQASLPLALHVRRNLGQSRVISGDLGCPGVCSAGQARARNAVAAAAFGAQTGGEVGGGVRRPRLRSADVSAHRRRRRPRGGRVAGG